MTNWVIFQNRFHCITISPCFQKDMSNLKERFRNLYLAHILPLWQSARLPEFKIGDPEVEEVPDALISDPNNGKTIPECILRPPIRPEKWS